MSRITPRIRPMFEDKDPEEGAERVSEVENDREPLKGRGVRCTSNLCKTAPWSCVGDLGGASA